VNDPNKKPRKRKQQIRWTVEYETHNNESEATTPTLHIEPTTPATSTCRIKSVRATGIVKQVVSEQSRADIDNTAIVVVFAIVDIAIDIASRTRVTVDSGAVVEVVVVSCWPAGGWAVGGTP